MHMLVIACSARGDHGDGNSPTDALDELDVIAFHRAVQIDGREQDLARAARFRFDRPLYRIPWRRLSAGVRVHGFSSLGVRLEVNRDHHTLRTKLPREGAD